MAPHFHGLYSSLELCFEGPWFTSIQEDECDKGAHQSYLGTERNTPVIRDWFQPCRCCCCLCYTGEYLMLGILISYNWAQVLEACDCLKLLSKVDGQKLEKQKKKQERSQYKISITHVKKSFVLIYVSNYNTQCKNNCTNQHLAIVYSPPQKKKKRKEKKKQQQTNKQTNKQTNNKTKQNKNQKAKQNKTNQP